MYCTIFHVFDIFYVWHVCMYLYVICACKCNDMCVYMYVCMYVCVCVCMCSIYVCFLYMCMCEHVLDMSLQQNKLVVMPKHITIGSTYIPSLCNTF